MGSLCKESLWEEGKAPERKEHIRERESVKDHEGMQVGRRKHMRVINHVQERPRQTR